MSGAFSLSKIVPLEQIQFYLKNRKNRQKKQQQQQQQKQILNDDIATNKLDLNEDKESSEILLNNHCS